jgi:uncharacterized small protein (DUF1192 family)
MEDKELTRLFVTAYLDKDDQVQKLTDEIKRLQAENEKLKNPPVWTNDGEL